MKKEVATERSSSCEDAESGEAESESEPASALHPERARARAKAGAARRSRRLVMRGFWPILRHGLLKAPQRWVASEASLDSRNGNRAAFTHDFQALGRHICRVQRSFRARARRHRV